MFTTLLNGAKGFMAGINWPLTFYKLLAAGTLIVGFGLVCYREGKHDCQIAAATAQITTLETRIITERTEVKKALDRHTKDINSRLSLITTNSGVLAKMDSKLEELKGGLDAAINARPANDACAPSDAELQYYTELARQAR